MDRREFLLGAATTVVLSQVAPPVSETSHEDSAVRSAAQRIRLSIDQGWRFQLGEVKNGYDVSLDDSHWRLLDIPHDWSIEGSFSSDSPSGPMGGYLPAGIAWYRRSLALPQLKQGARMFVEFDGIYMNSEVWINGRYLGKRPYGYTSFEYELTDFLRDDGAANLLAVRVDNSLQPNSRWYSGSGIYRHAWANLTSSIAVDHWGAFVTTLRADSRQACLQLEIRLRCGDLHPGKVRVSTDISDSDGTVVASVSEEQEAAESPTTYSFQVRVDRPNLWSPETPYLYLLRIVVSAKGRITDEYSTTLGIRTLSFDPDHGIILNGMPTKLRGVCIHHDLGALGAAFFDFAAERRLMSLKRMGCNAIRLAHNPPAPQLLDICDRMGFLVIDEAFDEWSVGKGNICGGYHLYFQGWAEQDLRDMILRDRNHPSVIMWSIGNEIPDKGQQGGVNTCKWLSEIARRHDPTRPVTAAINDIEIANKSGFAQMIDVVGYNGGGGSAFFYDIDHARYPRRKMYASEAPHTAQTRGVYRSSPEYCSSYDETFIDLTYEDSWKITKERDFLAGEFRWTGFDYLGEPARHGALHIPKREHDANWPARSSEAGVLDTCGFEKDAYFFYQSQWTTEPMLHLFPHWTWGDNIGAQVRVCCFTNCDFVELFLNDRSMGRKYAFRNGPLHVEWTVYYEPGTLQAVGWKDGIQQCEQIVRTAAPAARIELKPEDVTLEARNQNMAFIRATITDQYGNPVPDARNCVAFSISGPASLLAVDNGDTNCHQPFRGQTISAFQGLCLAVVRGTGIGLVTVKATSPGLQPDLAVLQSR